MVILHALPCQLTPLWFKEHKDIIPRDALIVVTAKGLYLKTNQLMGHAILDALDRSEQPLAFLSGPSFAEEILKGNPTTLVVASDERFHGVRVQKMMSNFKTVKVFTSVDPVGVQVSYVTIVLLQWFSAPMLTYMILIIVQPKTAGWGTEESFGSGSRHDIKFGFWYQHTVGHGHSSLS